MAKDAEHRPEDSRRLRNYKESEATADPGGRRIKRLDQLMIDSIKHHPNSRFAYHDDKDDVRGF